MTRELGAISDLQAAEIALETPNLTLGFDATTQVGVHVNCIYFTTSTFCQVIAIDQLAGGTAADYAQHVLKSVDHLSEVYSDFHHTDFQDCRCQIISNITNTMSDRAVVNHATVQKISEA